MKRRSVAVFLAALMAFSVPVQAMAAYGIYGPREAVSGKKYEARWVDAGSEEEARIAGEIEAENREKLQDLLSAREISSERKDFSFAESSEGKISEIRKSGAELTEGAEYKEGSALVVVLESDKEAATGAKGDEIDEMLSSASELMDVSEAMAEETGECVTGGYGEGKAVIKYVTSDKYDTAELIDRLNEKDCVYVAEPDYILHVTDEDSRDGMPIPEADNSAFSSEQEELSEESDVFLNGEEGMNEEGAEGDDDTGYDGITKPYPDFTSWQYDNVSGNGGIDVPNWNSGETNCDGVVVAVVDSGVDYNNPELKDIMWRDGLNYPKLVELGGGEYGFCPAISDSKGNLYDHADPMDDNFHGTLCAGIIGAAWDGQGISGVANGVKIMAVKPMTDDGSGYITDIIKGWKYVLEAKRAGVNVEVVNNSFNVDGASRIITLAFEQLRDAGILLVIAAGNETIDTDLQYYIHSSEKNNDACITVGASGIDGELTGFSNYGRRTVEVVAPGKNILSSMWLSKRFASPGICSSVKNAAGDDALWDFEGALAENPFTDADEKLSFSVCEKKLPDCASGNHALKISGISAAGRERKMKLSLGNSLEESRPKYLTFFARIDGDTYYGEKYAKFEIGLKVPLTDGTRKKFTFSRGQGWIPFFYELPEDTDYSNLDLEFILSVDYIEEDVVDIIMDDITFTNETMPYTFQNGTSMSCPKVTGMAAVCAAAFRKQGEREKSDRDRVALLRARILAGVVQEDRYEEKCLQMGRVNLRRSLDEDAYIPVVNDVQVSDDGTDIKVTGFFFGKDPEVTINGEKLTVGSSSDRELTAKLPADFISGEYEVRVASSNGEGRHYCVLLKDKTASGLYDRIDLPTKYLDYSPLAGIGGKIYFSTGDKDSIKHLLCYEPGADKPWQEVEDIEGLDRVRLPELDKCGVLNDYLVYFQGNRLATVDIVNRRCIGYAVFDELSDDDNIDIVNVGKELYIMVSFGKSRGGNSFQLSGSEIYKLSMSTDLSLDMDLVATLSNDHYAGRLVSDGRDKLFAVFGECGDIIECVSLSADRDPDKTEVRVLNDDVFPDEVGFDPFRRDSWSVVGTQENIMIFQPKTLSGNGFIKADSYMISPDNGQVKACDKKLAYSPVFQTKVLCYRDRVYVAGYCYDEKFFDFLSVIDAKTPESAESIWATSGTLAAEDAESEIEAGGEKFRINYSPYVFYTGKKHTGEGQNGVSADLRFSVSGNGTDKFYVKTIKTKNGKDSTVDPYGKELEGVSKIPSMVPVLAPVKGGEKLTGEDKARLKALNAYLKANPLRFDVIQLSFSSSRCDLYGALNSKKVLKKLEYADMEKLNLIKVNKKEYSAVTNEDGTIDVTANPGGNFSGSAKLYTNPEIEIE